MRCVLYLRMSTDRQDCSIAQQREALVAFAAKHDHEIVGEYLDEGISGDKTEKRIGFQAMIRDASTGDFDRILCFDQDRFGRFDMIEAGSWIMPLRAAGVSLETIAQGAIDWNDFSGRLTYAVAQEGKHQFLLDLSRNVVRGLTAKAKDCKGYTGGPTPYGYRRITEHQGKSRISTLVLDELTAPIVRQMFEEYAKPGGSCRQVVEFLNGSGIAPVRGQIWRRNAVNRILQNRVYRGDYVWGRRNKGRYHSRAGDEIVRRRPGQAVVFVPPIIHENAVPAIVDRELFDRVQDLLLERQRATRSSRTVHPLSGLISCRTCGRPMHADCGDYRCSSPQELVKGERCSHKRVKGDALLDAVRDGLQKHLLSPARLKSVKARLERIVKAQASKSGSEDEDALRRRIEELDRQLAEGIARIPLMPKSLVPEMAKGLDRLRAQRDSLVRQRDAVRDAQAGRSTPVAERVALALAAAYGLREALRKADSGLVNEHLRRLGVRITVDTEKRAGAVGVDPIAVASGDLSTMEACSGQVPRKPLVSFEIEFAA